MTHSALERRQRILSEVLEKRHVTARGLAGHLAVSEATVRRDLKALADEGHIDLVYGGATIRRPVDYSLRSKETRNVEEKRIIGRLAADMVSDGDTVFLDSGSTALELASLLKRRDRLTVIINSTRLAMELDSPNLNVVMLGGQYRASRMDTVGRLAMSTLEQLRGYVCFIGADGLDMDIGPSAADIESADLYRLAVRNARKTLLLVDHTKFAAPSLFRIVPWSQISAVVTDCAPRPQWAEFFHTHDIDVIYPPDSAGGADK